MLQTILLIFQIAVPVLLAVCILLQQRGAALGSAFGGEGGFYASRRGAEKKIFILTIEMAVIFIIVSLLSILVKTQ
ncbi:MAG: preprotein translocase subunit SecG [Patescibacteria group bacterium]|nr:preprotein translocase subunit SecG [Patescibacteria group bacterium]